MSNKILVLFAHPLLEKSRANQVLLKAYQQHENCTFHDLYEEYPAFDVDIPREQQLLEEHDFIIWHHPIYWYSCPPLLKQWIDMVLTVGWAYGPGGMALRGKKIMQAITTGGSEAMYQQEGNNRYTIPEFLRPFEQTARLCHMEYLPPFVVHGTHRLSAEKLEEALGSLGQLLDILSEERNVPLDWSPFPSMHHFLTHRSTL